MSLYDWPLLVRWLPILACSLLAALLPAQAVGQNRPGLVSFQRVAMPDDVPAHLSTAMVQDKHGFLWIGTQDGLVRFDGYAFKVFRARPGDPGALGGSYVRSLMVARDGRLWVGTISGGLAVLDPHTERFTQYRHDAAKPGSLAHDRVEAIAEDRDGQLWIGTDNGLDRLNPVTGAIRHYRHDDADPESLASDQVRSLLIDRQQRVWVGSRAGLQRLHDGRRFARVGDASASPAVGKLSEDARGRIWIGTTEQGAAVLDPASGKLQAIRPAAKGSSDGLSHYWVYGFAEPLPGEMWIATFGGGIDVVDAQTLKVIDRLRSDSAAVSTIGNDRIGALLVDRSGMVWAGSWGGGLARHDPSTRAFLKLRHRADNPDGPTHPAIVRAMEAADGSLWLGTNGNGVDIMSADGHLRGGLRLGQLADGSVSCMLQTPDGTAWVATLDGTLHRIKSGEITRLGTADGLPGGPIRTMVTAPDGSLWAGSLNGLARIEPLSRKVTSFAHRANDPNSLSGREVESLAFGPDGTLWVGTENGLNAFNTDTGKAIRIMREPGRSDGLPDNWVPDMMVARDGRLWLATQSGVAILRQWDGRVAHFDHLNQRLNLPERPVESLLEDAQGQVWLGGRVRVDPATWRARTYGPAEGNEFRTLYIASRARTRDGRLLFGSPEGLVIVRPEQLGSWDYQPAVAPSVLTVEGAEVPGAASLSQLVLQPEQRNLRLEFAAFDMSAPHRLHYRYRLDGYDANWVVVDAAQRVAAYTGLPPGDYTLRIEASNRDGQWSPHQWSMRVTVTPAFYQTWWFRVLCWLFVVLAVLGLFRLRLRQLRLRGIELERIVAERTAALEAAYRRIEEASLTDPLTQLRNRRFLEQALPADLELVARRHSGGGKPDPASDLVLFMLDLDHFKQVNDLHGHAAGDAVLIQTAALLKQCMRASDYVVRWGGEEFLLVARFVEREQGAQLAEKIRAAVAEHVFVLPDGSTLRKTVSIGFAAFPFVRGLPTAVTLDTLQHIADCALYAAKRSWRDGWVGIESRDGAAAGDVEESVRSFLFNAEAAVAAGGIEVLVAPSHRGAVRWS